MLFNEKLKLARKVRNLSQEEVAKALGICRSNISKYESGQAEPDIKTISQLKNIYMMDLNWLFDTTQKE